MEGDLIGLFALLVGLELILGVDNILVIAILVSRLPESKRNSTRIMGLAVALLARIVMVVAGLKLLELTSPAWTDGPDWFRYSWKDLALLAGGLFLIWKAVKEIHSTVELEDHGDQAKAKNSFFGVVMQILILDIVFSLDSVITAVGLTDNKWVIIIAVLFSFVIIMFFAKPIGDFILQTRRAEDSGSLLSHRNRNHDFHGGNGQASGQATDLRSHGVCHGHSISPDETQVQLGKHKRGNS